MTRITSTLHEDQRKFMVTSGGIGIATDHGLDGPGSNPGGDEIFRPSRPALEHTQPLVDISSLYPEQTQSTCSDDNDDDYHRNVRKSKATT